MFLISSILAGVSMSFCLYLLLSPATRRTAVPQAYRQKKFLTILWPWIDVLGRASVPFMSWKYREKVQLLLRHAGLERVATLDHLAGIQCLAATFLFVSGVLLQRSVLPDNLMTAVLISSVMAAAGYGLPLLWLKDLAGRRRNRILSELPFLLDMTTLCVEAGQNLHGALIHTVELCPPGVLREELRHSLIEIRAGRPRIDALRAMATRTGTPEIGRWVTAIAQAESMGMGLGSLLRSQSEQRRQERFSRAEKRALEAPVKMLMPLIFCIFPCTFIVLAFPIAVKILHSGV